MQCRITTIGENTAGSPYLSGGCHLVDASNERIMKTIDALKELNVQRVGVSHCTGPRAAAIMANELGERFFFNMVGTRVQMP
ncbi:hypothetical protein ACFLUT_04140 [Chloroflexota bacterium]